MTALFTFLCSINYFNSCTRSRVLIMVYIDRHYFNLWICRIWCRSVALVLNGSIRHSSIEEPEIRQFQSSGGTVFVYAYAYRMHMAIGCLYIYIIVQNEMIKRLSFSTWSPSLRRPAGRSCSKRPSALWVFRRTVFNDRQLVWPLTSTQIHV